MKTSVQSVISTLVVFTCLFCCSYKLCGQTETDTVPKHTDVSLGIGSNNLISLMIERRSPFLGRKLSPYISFDFGRASRCSEYSIRVDTINSWPREIAECKNMKSVSYVDLAFGLGFLHPENRSGAIGQAGLRYRIGIPENYNFGVINTWGYKFLVSENFYLRADVDLDIGISYFKNGLDEWSLIVPDFGLSFLFRIGYRF